MSTFAERLEAVISRPPAKPVKHGRRAVPNCMSVNFLAEVLPDDHRCWLTSSNKYYGIRSRWLYTSIEAHELLKHHYEEYKAWLKITEGCE